MDQYQCYLIELFLRHYLTIYHKNYSHSEVPAATVALATNALSQTAACANSAHLPIVHVPPPSSICARPHLIWFLPTSGHLTVRPKSGRLQNLGLRGLSSSLFSRSAHASPTSWHSAWLMYGQTAGRQSLTGPSMSGESGFRPVCVWKDTISNMSFKSFLFQLIFYR